MPPPSSVNHTSEIINGITTIVTWTLVVAGWHFARKDNNSRENRHDLRASIDALTKEIIELEQTAFKYYQLDPCPEAELLELEMKRRQDALDKRVGRLSRADGHFSSGKEMTEFRKHLTGGDFEQAARRKITVKDRKLLEISLATNDLIAYLETEYDVLYTPKPKKK